MKRIILKIIPSVNERVEVKKQVNISQVFSGQDIKGEPLQKFEARIQIQITQQICVQFDSFERNSKKLITVNIVTVI